MIVNILLEFMSYKIAIIGEKDDILPYQSIGLEIEPVKTREETVNAFKKITQDSSVGIILITENMAEQCLDTITGLRNKTAKAMSIIPTQQENRGVSAKELKKEIGRSVGVDIT